MLWHSGGKAASSTCGLARGEGRGGEVRRGEAWDGSLMRTGGKMAVNGEREQRRDGTPAQMTPREIEKGGAKPAPSPVACLYCVYRRGDGMQAW